MVKNMVEYKGYGGRALRIVVGISFLAIILLVSVAGMII